MPHTVGLLAALCISLAIALTSFVLAPPKFLYPYPQVTGQSATVAAKDADLNGSTWFTKDAAGFFAGCAFVVAIAQAFFFYHQLKYMREDISLSARTWVFAGPTVETIGADTDGNILFEMRAINYGKTPALFTELYFGFSAVQPEGPANYENCTRIDANFPLGPDKDSVAILDPTSDDGAFTVPAGSPYFYGYVVYLAANARHESRFSYLLGEDEQGNWFAQSVGGADWHRFD